MNLIALQPLGRNRDIHRLWIESQRLHRLGFAPGTPLEIRSQSGQLTLKPAILGENHVSSRLVPGGRRPWASRSVPALCERFARAGHDHGAACGVWSARPRP